MIVCSLEQIITKKEDDVDEEATQKVAIEVAAQLCSQIIFSAKDKQRKKKNMKRQNKKEPVISK